MENNKYFTLLIVLVVLSVLNLGVNAYILKANLSSTHAEQHRVNTNQNSDELNKKLDNFFEKQNEEMEKLFEENK